jgi:hypothetical protein
MLLIEIAKVGWAVVVSLGWAASRNVNQHWDELLCLMLVPASPEMCAFRRS